MSQKITPLIVAFLGVIYCPKQPMALLRVEDEEGRRFAIPVNSASLLSLQTCLDALPRTVTGRSRSDDDGDE